MRSKLLTLVLLGVGSAPALAGDVPVAEIYGGYAYLRDQSIEENFTKGWVASLTANLTDNVGFVGEIGGSYKSVSVSSGGVSVSSDLSVYSYMGGLRLAGHSDTGLFYVQVLAGIARLKLGVAVGGVGGEVASDSEFALQPGLGFDIRLGQSVALRLGGDYRRIFAELEGIDEFRAHGGLVFRIGSR